MKHRDTFATIEGRTDYSLTRYHQSAHQLLFRVKVMKNLKEANVFHAAQQTEGKILDLEARCCQNPVAKWVITLIKQPEEEVNTYLQEMENHFVVTFEI